MDDSRSLHAINLCPSPEQIRGTLVQAGFLPGELPSLTRRALDGLSHAIGLADLTSLQPNRSRLADCASVLLRAERDLVEADDRQRSEAISVFENVFIGPLQLKLLDALATHHYRPEVLSGYRSVPYQALLFAVDYLNGTVFDSFRRYRVAPPGFSDHQRVDGALDVADSNLFLLHLLLLEGLPFSQLRPYLSDPLVSYEPWHWRCVAAGSDGDVDETRKGFSAPSPSLIRELIGYCMNASSEVRWREHVFISGVSRCGAAKCVGSLQETFAASVSDARVAVGDGWESYHVTIPEGYTPIMDNNVLEQDIGRCTFRIEPGAASSAKAYLTGQSCVTFRVNRPEAVKEELLKKAGITDVDRHRLYKSRSLDLIEMPDGTLMTAAYGLPMSRHERPQEAPALIVSDYCRWLMNGLSMGLPIYFSDDYARTYSQRRDHMRYAMVLSNLSRFRAVLPDTATPVRERLYRNYCRGNQYEFLCTGGELDEDTVPEATIVFLSQALHHLDEPEKALELSAANAARIGAYVHLVLDNPGNPNGWLFIGPLCELLTKTGSALDTIHLDKRALTEILAYKRWNPLYACAFSQMLAYLHSRDPADAWIHRESEDLLAWLLSWATASPALEHGAFSGLESFQTALPLEAMQNLTTFLPLSETDAMLVRKRIVEGSAFLRRLQFQSSFCIPTPNPQLLDGAVRYSLLDHHFRIDYGMHASKVALQLLYG